MSDDELIEKISSRVAVKLLDALPWLRAQESVVPPEWISQNKASKIVGRKRLEEAKKRGVVAWQKKDFDNPRSRVYVKSADVSKLMRKPF
jgi:hypothetical protein